MLLAAGEGARFGGHKQFQRLGGERLADRALRLIRPHCAEIVVALPGAVQWDGAEMMVTGGKSRLESLRLAMAAVSDEASIVVVQDCIRPLTRDDVVDDLLRAVRNGADAAIPAFTPSDVIKCRSPDGSLAHVGREELVVAQSPNACRALILHQALEQTSPDAFIEETQAIEAIGGRVVAVEGDPWAHHIIDDIDLAATKRLV
ncbi:MAG: 2-C-methyl-D-erythritol 4-phosphate cytidylyltransferase [Pseudomonadales bacterium]|nr:2-C-methyl-D-erythritol 4-phosphate cytidylyltransferase [Pseudomonadales bacterium]